MHIIIDAAEMRGGERGRHGEGARMRGLARAALQGHRARDGSGLPPWRRWPAVGLPAVAGGRVAGGGGG
jgi:hypothetical protein